MTDDFHRTIIEATRRARNDALDAAIEICQEFARTGHNAECCVHALKDMKEMLPKPPSETN